jgi:hypothetical protein
MRELSASIDVPAPPATVWEVLTDVAAYPRWNTLLRVRGDLTETGTVSARLSVPGLPTIPFRPRVLTVVPEREVRWRTTLFGQAAEHAFLLEPTDDGTGTRFTQHERIDGPLANPVVSRLERRMRRGFDQMNVGLRRRAIELAES